jgi:hypothetical protein
MHSLNVRRAALFSDEIKDGDYKGKHWSHFHNGPEMKSNLNYPRILTVSYAVPQLRRLVVASPPRRSGLEPGSGHVGFVMDKVALGQVFSEYFVSPANLHSIDCSKSSFIIWGSYSKDKEWPKCQANSVSPHEKINNTLCFCNAYYFTLFPFPSWRDNPEFRAT